MGARKPLANPNPFHPLPMFRETRDGRHFVALNLYPKVAARALSFLKSDGSIESVQHAIRQWDADDLEKTASAAGLVFAKVRTFEEFSREPQYKDVLSRMPLIRVEKIGESDPVPLEADAYSPLACVRAFGVW